MKTVPRDEHHVLGTAIHAHEVVGYQIPRKRSLVEEVVLVLIQELGRVALAGVYPLPESLHCRLVLRIRRRPCLVCLEAELQRIVEVGEVGRAEETDWLGVIEELQADALVAPAGKRRLVVETLNALEAIDDG